MKRRIHISYFALAGFILVFAGILLAQNNSQKPLVVNGKAIGTAIQMGGHSYVDVETIAQFTNGSVTLEPNRVVLSFPPPQPAPETSSDNGPAPTTPPTQLSRNFASLAIGELAEMREWRGAVGTILQYGVPVVGTWPQDYRDHVEANLRQVQLAVSSPGDDQAMQLLQNEFNNLSSWAGNVVSTRQNLNATNTIGPDPLQGDPALAKINACARFLGSMFVSGNFADDSSCH